MQLLPPRIEAELSVIAHGYGHEACNFGPEFSWATQKGVEYDHFAQQVIGKSKRLCMDYNAGLLSPESYLRASRQIDAAVDRAAEVRQGMMEFNAALEGAVFARADRIFERERNQKRR